MKLHELRQKRNNIAKQMRALHEEIGDNAWTEEQRSNWDNAQGEHDKIAEQIERLEKLEQQDQRFVESDEGQEQRDSRDNSQEIRQQSAFDAFIRRGLSDMDAEQRQLLQEMRAQSVGDNTKGGYTVPVEFRQQVVDAMKAYGGIASVCQILNTDSGAPIEWATTDGTTEEGELIGENTAATEQDVAFGIETLGAIKLSSKIIRVSNELLNDSAVNAQAILTGRIATRLGRTESRLIVQGTGAGTPKQNRGLENSVTLSQAAGAAAAISYDDFINVKHKVDPAYRNGASVRYTFNDTTFKACKLLKDSENRPLWLPSIAGVAPATIDGEQFVIDQAMANIGTGNVSVFYGDFNRFILRRVNYMVLRRLVERYAEFDQTAFLAFHRFDTVLEDTGAIAALTHP